MKPISNKQRQAKFRARMKREGYVQIALWIPKSRKEEVMDYVRKHVLANPELDSCTVAHHQIDIEDMT